ncbi:DinB family protein [Nakamurella sp. YIM 132087]|uniref:DinB family protein n=1 Tax=Nakamurella alba TaxID=2665158 RepID=A0A7K1FGS1_9ACTN|nr:DinB family protein [Nakamurella alba]MTD13325.1 DinB family protein [Nakamurella alba]
MDEGREFTGVDLTGARFRMVDLSGAMLRSVALAGAEIDGEADDLAGLTINGVDVMPLVLAELERRQPARVLLRSDDPADLRAAWDEVERGWAGLVAMLADLPAGSDTVSVEGEWSFRQTTRHLVFVTDAWLGQVLGQRPRFHPWGLAFTDMGEFVPEGTDLGLDDDADPPLAELLEVRAGRMQLVRDLLADADAAVLATEIPPPPWAGDPVSTLRCLRVVLREECEHQRFAGRDLARVVLR